MDWKDIIVIIFAVIVSAVFTPKVTPPILRWLEKIGILKGENSKNKEGGDK